MLERKKIPNSDFGLPSAYDEFQLVDTTDVIPLEVLSARYVGTNVVFLLVEVEVEGEFEFYIDNTEADELAWRRASLSYDITQGYGAAYDFQTFRVTLALEVDLLRSRSRYRTL